jgi:outer membrane protein
MKRLVSSILVALAPALAVAQVPDTTARPVSLDEAVKMAQRNSPQAVQARGNEKQARAAVRSTYYSFLPSLSASLGETRQFTGGAQTRLNAAGERVTIPVEPWSANNGLQFGLELFDGGRRLYQLKSDKAAVDASEANSIAQEFQIELNVKQQYFNILAARESEAAARAQLQQAEEQLKASVARVTAGAATKSDSLRSLIQVGNGQLALLTAQNNLRVANAALTRLVAAPYTITAAETDTVDALVPVDSMSLVEYALRGPAVLQAQSNLAVARASRRAAKTPYLPTINASYSRSGSGLDTRFGLGDKSYGYNGQLRFSLNYQLWNQGSREEAIVRANVAEDNAEAALRDARLAATATLTQYIAAVQTADQRIRIQLASVAAAEEDLRVQQQRYNLGASTLLDVLTSQSTLNQARSALIQARYDYRTAKAQIEALVGRKLQ